VRRSALECAGMRWLWVQNGHKSESRAEGWITRGSIGA
jgi:hypothetical protein